MVISVLDHALSDVKKIIGQFQSIKRKQSSHNEWENANDHASSLQSHISMRAALLIDVAG
jgi:hypothetical protein